MFTVILCALYVYSIVFHLILTCKTSWRQFSWYVARDEDESYKTNLEHSLFLCLLSEIWWWLKEKPFILSNNGISWYKAFSSRNLYLHWGKIMQQKSQWRSVKKQVFVWISYFILDFFFSQNTIFWLHSSNNTYSLNWSILKWKYKLFWQKILFTRFFRTKIIFGAFIYTIFFCVRVN